MTLKIYGIGASRAVRPIWTALELGVPFEHIPTPFQGGATRTPEFLALNPNGHIPVLEDERADGAVTVWESMACALYIARVHGQADGQSITSNADQLFPRFIVVGLPEGLTEADGVDHDLGDGGVVIEPLAVIEHPVATHH